MFELEFEFSYGKNWPKLEFCDTSTQNEYSIDPFTKRVNIKVNPGQNKLEFSNTNKNDYDTIIKDGQIVRDQTVKLVRMWVDDVLLNFDYILSSIKFIPNYKESFLQYCSQHNITVDHNPHPLELFHNGTWIFTFEKPFWSWYAQQRQRNINVKFNSDEIELYIGIESINKNTNFEKLKKLLDV